MSLLSAWLFAPLPSSTTWLFFVAFIATILGFVFFRLATLFGPRNKYFSKTLKKRPRWPLTVLSVLGLILLLARLGELEYLSMRIFLVVVTLLIVLRLVYDFALTLTQYRRRLASAHREHTKHTS